MKNIMRFLGIAAIVFSIAFMAASCDTSKAGKAEEEKAEKDIDEAVDTLKKINAAKSHEKAN